MCVFIVHNPCGIHYTHCEVFVFLLSTQHNSLQHLYVSESFVASINQVYSISACLCVSVRVLYKDRWTEGKQNKVDSCVCKEFSMFESNPLVK